MAQRRHEIVKHKALLKHNRKLRIGIDDLRI